VDPDRDRVVLTVDVPVGGRVAPDAVVHLRLGLTTASGALAAAGRWAAGR
jgi:hypothetical protein